MKCRNESSGARQPGGHAAGTGSCSSVSSCIDCVSLCVAARKTRIVRTEECERATLSGKGTSRHCWTRAHQSRVLWSRARDLQHGLIRNALTMYRLDYACTLGAFALCSFACSRRRLAWSVRSNWVLRQAAPLCALLPPPPTPPSLHQTQHHIFHSHLDFSTFLHPIHTKRTLSLSAKRGQQKIYDVDMIRTCAPEGS